MAWQSQEQAEQLLTNIVSTVPLGRMGSPDEVAKAASFLALDDSSYVTRIELFVDGGVV
jgi:NAD(P)-dependent dehydrogenase (short-subunit alcohol dehydrogenase family)